MPTLVEDLNSLDFSVYIGGPLQAAINAQTDASLAQLQFIQDVGFTGGSNNELRYVTFKYNKTTINSSGAQVTTPVDIVVPLLSLVTIPSIRVEEMTIDFIAKLTSVETTDTQSLFNIGGSLGVKLKKVKFNIAASYMKSVKTGANVTKSYSLNVHVKAVNDELPEGMEKLLTMLGESLATA
jgi:hypothetical protein